MGFLEFVAPIVSLFSAFSGQDEDDSSTTTTTTTATEADTTTTTEEAEKKRKQALIAANAGVQETSPLQNEETEVTKKTLLGL